MQRTSGVLRSILALPFKPRHKAAMLAGTKDQTARFTRYGIPGDTLTAFGAQFELTEVFREDLGTVFARDWQREGFESEDDFRQEWSRLHPMRWQNDRRVWVHRFRKVA